MQAETTIYKTLTFDTAHQLDDHEKCGKLHGHTYKAEVWITGKSAGRWKFILDFNDVKNYFNQFDHSDKVVKVSVETMAEEAADYFYNLKINVNKVVVRLWETPTAYAEAVRG